MSGRSSAARYARALLDVASKEADPVLIGRELDSFSALVGGHALLRETLGNPGIDTIAKKKIVDQLTVQQSISLPLRKLFGLLADRNRLSLLAELNDAYQERLREHLGVVQAEVTTAGPLDATHVDVLQARLQQATGRQVVLTTRVDATIIGGMVARVGGTVFDGSVSGGLSRLRARLLER